MELIIRDSWGGTRPKVWWLLSPKARHALVDRHLPLIAPARAHAVRNSLLMLSSWELFKQKGLEPLKHQQKPTAPLSLTDLKAESILCLAKQLLVTLWNKDHSLGWWKHCLWADVERNNSPKARLNLPVVGCSPSQLRKELLFGSTTWNSTCDISALPLGRRLNLNTLFPLLLVLTLVSGISHFCQNAFSKWLNTETAQGCVS